MARTLPPIAMLVILAGAVASANAPRVPHIRVRDAGLERLLQRGLDRSPMLRRLVQTLDESDVIVYVELQPRMPHSLPAGLVLSGAGGGMRYLRISLHPRNTQKQMIEMLGHELQHAVEIAGEASVQSPESLSAHFARIGRRTDNGWETDAARDAGRIARREFTAGTGLATSLAKRSVLERE
jgi:hypothetical protein